jgi:hypothetical protein
MNFPVSSFSVLFQRCEVEQEITSGTDDGGHSLTTWQTIASACPCQIASPGRRYENRETIEESAGECKIFLPASFTVDEKKMRVRNARDAFERPLSGNASDHYDLIGPPVINYETGIQTIGARLVRNS